MLCTVWRCPISFDGAFNSGNRQKVFTRRHLLRQNSGNVSTERGKVGLLQNTRTPLMSYSSWRFTGIQPRWLLRHCARPLHSARGKLMPPNSRSVFVRTTLIHHDTQAYLEAVPRILASSLNFKVMVWIEKYRAKAANGYGEGLTRKSTTVSSPHAAGFDHGPR